jgi:isoprenylcysteine carboxyl methyltransferase (ICMT) family protein YpbQ
MISWLRNLVSHNRIWVSSFIGILFFLAARPTFLSMGIGLPVVLLGETIRIWSSGHIVKNDSLTMSGPYRLTRNPLYLGNFFLGLGFVVMAGVPLMIFLFVPIFFFIYEATISEEEKFLAERYGEAFRSYQKMVPRFFPKMRLDALSTGRFSWSLVKKHREANTWLAILVGVLLFLFKMWIYPGAS